MIPIENTNPLKGATYEVFFPGILFKGINKKTFFDFDVESHSPSGLYVKKATVQLEVETEIPLCYDLPHALQLVYE